MLLLIVLTAVAMLSLGAYQFADVMLAERQAAQVHGRALQAQALADSGLQSVQGMLMQDAAARTQAGGLFDNPLRFQGQMIVDDGTPRGRGRFTVVAPAIDGNGVIEGIRFGLENESARLNLNTLLVADQVSPGSGRTLLMALPGMTQDVADAILDWLDTDDEPREFGAEQDVYASLSPPYRPKNGPLDTVEELLLVRGVTPGLLFGPDVNRNGTLDAHEGDGASVDGVDNSTGALNGGWASYLTLYGAEVNAAPDLTPKINLNNDDLTALDGELRTRYPGEWATFIVAYRLGGDYTGSTKPVPARDGQLDLTKKPKKKLSSVLDLIGAKTQVTFQGESKATVLDSPFVELPAVMNTYMPLLMDYSAVNTATVIPGRINVNQAPKALLLGIPGMTEEIATQILSNRDFEVTEERAHRRHETWLLSEGIVTLAQMREIFPFVTCGGNTWRVQVVGYFEEGGPAVRLEAIVQENMGDVRLISQRDLSHLGRGFPLEQLGVGGASGP